MPELGELLKASIVQGSNLPSAIAIAIEGGISLMPVKEKQKKCTSLKGLLFVTSHRYKDLM